MNFLGPSGCRHAQGVFLFLCLLFVGCGRQINYFDPADSQLSTKLGIGEKDLDAIRQLSSKEKGFAIMGVGRAGENVIEVEFKKIDDLQEDKGGPVNRYETKDGIWKKQENFIGYWAGVHAR
jgi:hypothetical protein